MTVARPSAEQPFVMRPSIRQSGRVVGSGLAIGGGYAAFRLYIAWQRGDRAGQITFVIILLVLFGGVGLGYLLFFMRARIEVDEARILKVGIGGSRRSYPLDSVGGIAFRSVRSPMSRTGDPEIAVVYSRDVR